MRRSCFYMNMRFTQRHLNAIRSPLLTGYVNTVSGTTHAASLLNPPALAACSVAASATAAAMNAPLAEDLMSGMEAAGNAVNSSLIIAWAELSARPIISCFNTVLVKVKADLN